MQPTYEHAKIEAEIAKFWKENGTYAQAKQRNAGGAKFYFCDGPPYATGTIHPGTAWNKCIKDAVCRHRRMLGFNVRTQPGFDTHGLPIEVKVEKELKLKNKKDIEKMGVERFIAKCKEFATQYMGVMSAQFARCGVWMNWDAPYVTYKDEYIEASWKTIKSAHEKGLLERDEYGLPYCPRCETTMANYELEYGEQSDPSIYVKFPLAEKDEFLLVWTTTPWTLVANMAVMAHPDYAYVRVRVDGETWILAKERMDAVLSEAKKSGIVLEELRGKALEGMRYGHPLLQQVPKQKEFAKRFHRVVLSSRYVTLEEGTGLVHTAPGHGPQDFEVGKANGIPAFCPLDSAGRYTADAGKYAGAFVRDANETIVADLGAMLVHKSAITHRYPHCWRCKTPLIYVATTQWFIRISRMREKMQAEARRATWQPDFALTWFSDFIEAAPDWCISRQRYWGIPLPIWICERCGKTEVFDSRKALEKRSGATLQELHKPHIDKITLKCACGGASKRVSDVLDVWFDSGNAVWASLSARELDYWYPADFIVEGKDQMRGWFYSLLGSGVVARNETPFRSVLMHGFFVDERGEKMSKSLGNFVPLEDVLDKYGADTFRLWSMSSTTWEDLKFNWDEVKDAYRCLTIFWNVAAFVERFAAVDEAAGKAAALEDEDAWLLSRLNGIAERAGAHFADYSLFESVREYREFIVEDLSRFYLKLAKKRIAEGRNKQAVYYALYHALLTLCKLAAPVIPFVTEATYQRLFSKHERLPSIHLLQWPAADASKINATLEKEMAAAREIASAVSNARQKAGIRLRWPVEEAIVEASDAAKAAEALTGIIETIANVKKIRFGAPPVALHAKPVFARLGPAFKQDANAVGRAIEGADAKQMKKAFDAGKQFALQAGDKKHSVSADMVKFEEVLAGYAEAESSVGRVYVKTAISEALYAEAMAREVARRIQQARKEMKLVESDAIEANVIASAAFIEKIKKHEKKIAKEIRAQKLYLSEAPALEGKRFDWEIEGEKVSAVIVGAGKI